MGEREEEGVTLQTCRIGSSAGRTSLVCVSVGRHTHHTDRPNTVVHRDDGASRQHALGLAGQPRFHLAQPLSLSLTIYSHFLPPLPVPTRPISAGRPSNLSARQAQAGQCQIRSEIARVTGLGRGRSVGRWQTQARPPRPTDRRPNRARSNNASARRPAGWRAAHA